MFLYYSYCIQTPQAPMVRPYLYDYYNVDNYPLGTNAVVAVISYTVGYLSVSIHLSQYTIYLSIYPSVRLSVCLTICLVICLSISFISLTCIYLSIYVSIYLSIYLSTFDRDTTWKML